MRLIDADALPIVTRGKNHHRKYVFADITDAPTIAAIPVGWIMKWSNKRYRETQKDVSIVDVLEAWRKEQEAHRSSYSGMWSDKGGEIMPTSFEISDMVMYSVDGIPFRLGNIKDVPTFDPGDPEGDHVAFTFAKPKEYTATMTIHNNVRKALNKIMYGWRTSGPIRKRVLERLRRRKYKEAKEDL